jgi:hypothetical protein
MKHEDSKIRKAMANGISLGKGPELCVMDS